MLLPSLDLRPMPHPAATHLLPHFLCSDGFMVGLVATALRFCRPFLADAAKKRGALQHLDPAYYAAHPYRCGSPEPAIAGGPVLGADCWAVSLAARELKHGYQA